MSRDQQEAGTGAERARERAPWHGCGIPRSHLTAQTPPAATCAWASVLPRSAAARHPRALQDLLAEGPENPAHDTACRRATPLRLVAARAVPAPGTSCSGENQTQSEDRLPRSALALGARHSALGSRALGTRLLALHACLPGARSPLDHVTLLSPGEWPGALWSGEVRCPPFSRTPYPDNPCYFAFH